MADQDDTFTLTIDTDCAGERLDRLLAARFDRFTRSRWKALIKSGALARDGEVFVDPSWSVREGEIYEAHIPEAEPATPKAEDIPLDILFEDKDLIIVNKPAGLVVHPAAGNWTGTLVNALLAHCPDDLSGVGGVARPGIVHRLDKDTSGALVVAKNDFAHQALTSRFAAHDIERAYEAVVVGGLRPAMGTVEAPIARGDGDRKKMRAFAPGKPIPDVAKHAVTHYRVLSAFGAGRGKLAGDPVASLVECRLETGRTHQIRVHMAHIGAPVLGDPVYGRRAGLPGLALDDDAARDADSMTRTFRRQALHAKILGFPHPRTGEALRFEAQRPADLARLISALDAL